MLKGYKVDNYTERALAILEYDVCYLSQANWGYGMSKEDVAQELRVQLWRKLHLYNPYKSSIKTWGWRVMRMRLIDMSRKKKELLDSDRRHHIDSEEMLYVLIHGDRRTHTMDKNLHEES